MKTQNMKDNIIFYNIPEYQGSGYEDCYALLHGFLQTEMNIPASNMNSIGFDRIHRIGSRQNGKIRPVIAKCATAKTKEIVFHFTRNLKGKPFGVSEQLPPEVNERRNHLMPRFKEAREANMKPKWKGDKLIVGGSVIAQPQDLLNFANAVPVPAEPCKIVHTDILTEQGSSFQGHATKLTDTDQVIPFLHQLFSNHSVAKATHNIYAYRIKSQSHNVENSCDDGEFGAGKRLLNLMREKNIINQCLIVTRWYGGKHMGPRRFDCILKSAIKAHDLFNA